ncbi:ArsR/SmtB family transcription factor [Acidiluteibacter ferrifornacis]|uniref:Metalloregulator ArsR/SmtB family transcription factor n=1 Tax=Acidiluteibacter ferrifornacis TaxID=2692424 RepID=A0A6N9NKW4_9FLAO|nr:metalloregulator ArsR/SmtB family transcription factor [Acidiluteibacter ferrifornacis]MBR9830505.1 helix-turn-helix transcriptional regulator [bacterium]NBG66553.1 metalloregulator ArsR/SmtB family transcription factor [Acidiluteibacter ferrifornacis]
MKSKETEISIEKMEKIADILKAIAHPVRLEILKMMNNSEALNVAQIMELTGLEQSLISHHLIKMKDKGVLKSVRNGRNINYSLVDPSILRLFDCIKNCNFI